MLEKPDGQKITVPDLSSSGPGILIKNGRVIDPANGIDTIMHVAVRDGKIESVTADVPAGKSFDRTIDAAGLWVTPGLVDMHVHLREPGREDKETIFSGTCAAAAGGFTSVACMPNTNPVLDEESKIRYVLQRAAKCPSKVYPVGSITKGLAGEELSPFGEMVSVGAKAISDDGKSVRAANLMKNACNYARTFDIPVLCHCEDHDLAGGGQMNEGEMSTRLGIRGIPAVSEESIVSRDIMLAEYTGAKVHICHVSTAGSLDIIRAAKRRGTQVTCETAPHYFSLTENSLSSYDTNKKMNPPLRTPADVQAILDALVDGTIDAIATDHAPHVPEDKDVEFDAAAFGVIGLEASVGACLTHLVHTGVLAPAALVKAMSTNPCRILNLDGGTLSVGATADMTLIDPERAWVVKASSFFSKSRNCVFEGASFKGQTTLTILDGRIVYERSA